MFNAGACVRRCSTSRAASSSVRNQFLGSSSRLHRNARVQMFYKSCRIEYVPVGVVGTIVPWNYPFHNVFNPVSAAVFAGCAIVVKVSEHASYSSKYYQRIIDAALLAAGAPLGLVQIITGAFGRHSVMHPHPTVR